MLYGNYRFKCRFETEAQLPEYKGSTLRGVFGRALKDVVCVLKRQECPDCLLRRECLYPSVFDPALAIMPDEAAGRADPPHPYVIQADADRQTVYPQGAPFAFNLLLFGPVNRRLPYFVYAMDQMGKIGIGKKTNGRRAAFRLESVESSGREIYNGGNQKLSDSAPWTDLKLESSTGHSRGTGAVTFQLETPLRLKHNNRLSPELPFHILVRAMLRRASALLNSFDGGEPELDYSGMVQRAGNVRKADNALAWEDWRRYSLRQDQAMMMGGLTGSITYEGDLEEYLPLIEFCARVHLGKQTSFGLGRFTWEASR